MILLLLLFITFSFAEKSACMTDFIALNHEILKMTGRLTEVYECYKELNGSQRILSHHLQSTCYVTEEMFYLHKGNRKISRCGEWIQVVGPSQLPLFCSINGIMRASGEYASEQYNKRTVFVSTEELVMIVLGGFTQVSKEMTQVTVGDYDNDMKLSPSLVPLKMEGVEDKVSIIVININKVVDRLTINNVVYYLEENNTFVVPKYEEKVTVFLLSIEDEKISFDNVDLTNINKKYAATVVFEPKKNEYCEYLPTTTIYDENNAMSNGKYLSWRIWQVNGNNQSTFFPYNSNEIVFKSIPTGTAPYLTTLTTTFMYPSPMPFGDLFSYGEFVFYINDPALYHQPSQINLFYHTNFESVSRTNISVQVSKLAKKMYFGEDGHTLKIKVFFDNSIKLQSSSIEIVHLLSVGTEIKLKSAKLFRRSNEIICDSSSFDCGGAECDIDDAETLQEGTRKWKNGCAPRCGKCRIGYKCTLDGMCIAEPNQNTRSSAQNVFIFAIIFLILIL